MWIKIHPANRLTLRKCILFGICNDSISLGRIWFWSLLVFSNPGELRCTCFISYILMSDRQTFWEMSSSKLRKARYSKFLLKFIFLLYQNLPKACTPVSSTKQLNYYYFHWRCKWCWFPLFYSRTEKRAAWAT